MKNNFLFKILTIGLLLGINATALAKSPPPGTGEADVKANILIKIDKIQSK